MMFEQRIKLLKHWFARKFNKDSFAIAQPGEYNQEMLENQQRPEDGAQRKKSKTNKAKQGYDDDSYMGEEIDNSRYPIESEEIEEAGPGANRRGGAPSNGKPAKRGRGKDDTRLLDDSALHALGQENDFSRFQNDEDFEQNEDVDFRSTPQTN